VPSKKVVKAATRNSGNTTLRFLHKIVGFVVEFLSFWQP
jgi:hypothetical protein